MNKPKAVADTETGLVLATVDLAASPERIFRALTAGAEIEHWWGADDVYHMRDWQADLRAGGRYTVNVVKADGNVYPGSGEFLEIDPPRKLAHTRIYDWDYPVLGRRPTTITYRMEIIADGTRLIVRHEGFKGCNDAAYDHAAGWERALGWLVAYLA